jgi:hypothetical protein
LHSFTTHYSNFRPAQPSTNKAFFDFYPTAIFCFWPQRQALDVSALSFAVSANPLPKPLPTLTENSGVVD